MEGKVIFKEQQGFHQSWLRFLLPTFIAIAVIISIIQFYTKEERLREAVFLVVLIALLSLFLFSIRLETLIKTDGIYVRFAPFLSRYMYYSWEVIDIVYIRTYHPVKEYGGWGMRSGLFGKGSAYNMSGTIGIQLVFKDGRRHLIGTRQPVAAAEALRRLGKLSLGE